MKANLDPFLSSVDALCNDINKRIRFLNSGGCAVFAAFMGQCLEKYGKVTIAVGSDDSVVSSLDEVRPMINANCLDDWNDNGVSFTHVIVEFTYNKVKYHIDSTGVHEAQKFTALGCWRILILKGRLSVQECTDLAASSGWNWHFDRANIPVIQKKIDAGFKDMFTCGFKPT